LVLQRQASFLIRVHSWLELPFARRVRERLPLIRRTRRVKTFINR
jgi:hypothetical protein